MAPTGQVLHDLARALVRRGHEVDVLCSQNSYEGGRRYSRDELLEGVRVRRFRSFGLGRRGLSRLLDYASFYFPLLLQALFRQRGSDLVLCLTTPPYLGLAGSVVFRLRGSQHAHWVMDVYPDVLLAHGIGSAGSRLYRLLQWLARAQFDGASLVVTLGPVMKQRLEPYARKARKLEWVALWGEAGPASLEVVARTRRERGWRSDELVLMYSGNMGLGHNLAEFLEAARRLGPGGPRWAFSGGGPRRSEVEEFIRAHPAGRVQLLPYVPREQLGESLSAADVHLVSLRRSWQGLILPSKIQGAFSVGRPVIFVGSMENEVAAWIRESGAGWLVAEGDVAGLLAAVEQAADATDRARRGSAALAYAREHFDRHRHCEEIAELLEASTVGNPARV